MTSELGPPFPQPHEDCEGLTPPMRKAIDWLPSEEEPLPTILHRIPAVPPRIPREEMTPFSAAIRIGLREHYGQRGLVVDFTHQHVTDFVECVLAHWSAAITKDMGS